MRTLTGHEGMIYALCFAPDGRTLAAGSRDRVVTLWDPDAGVVRSQFTTNREAVLALLFSPDGRTLAVETQRAVALWNVVRGRWRTTIPESYPRALWFTPDSRTLVTARALTVEVFDTVTGRRTMRRGQWSKAELMAITADGRTLAIAHAAPLRSLRLWDVASGERRAILAVRLPSAADALAFAPDGRFVAAGCRTGVVRLWDLAREGRRFVLEGHAESVTSVAFSPDGRLLASGSLDGTVRFWETATGREQAAFNWEIGRVWSLAFAPDGMTAAAGGDTANIVIWDVE
jgi:WD40 repeat protein